MIETEMQYRMAIQQFQISTMRYFLAGAKSVKTRAWRGLILAIRQVHVSPLKLLQLETKA